MNNAVLSLKPSLSAGPFLKLTGGTVSGAVTVQGVLTMASDLDHESDSDTKIGFDTNKQTYTVGGLVALQMTNTTQDLVEIGDVAGTGDWDLNFNNGQIFLEGSSGGVYIGDTVNTKMTQGLTINQGANDDEILTFKSSDIAHGMTTLTETDTYGFVKKVDSSNGGLRLAGFTGSTIGIRLNARITTDVTTKTTSSNGALEFRGYKKSGTTVGDMGSSANIVVMTNNVTTRWILDGSGNISYGGADDGSISDQHDDALLLSGFRAILSPKESPAHQRFKGFLKDTESILVQQGVLTAPLSKGGLVSDTALKGLLIDAIYQLNSKITKLEKKYNGVK